MKKIILLSTLLLSSPTFAMFCPNGFNQMNLGDTLEDVIKLCGAPDNQTVTNVSNLPQEWTYFVNPNPNSQGRSLKPQANTLKMIVAFSNNKVVNITMNDQSLVTTPVCGGNVHTGDTPEQVKAACGPASFINKGQPPQGETAETKITELKYGSATLTFENGKLKERK